MSSGYIEVAGTRSTARFPGSRQVFAMMALVLVALFSLILMSALGGSAIAQSVSQPDSVARRPLARSEQERADFNAAYSVAAAAREEAAGNDFSQPGATSGMGEDCCF